MVKSGEAEHEQLELETKNKGNAGKRKKTCLSLVDLQVKMNPMICCEKILVVHCLSLTFKRLRFLLVCEKTKRKTNKRKNGRKITLCYIVHYLYCFCVNNHANIVFSVFFIIS